jgi:hypothetical protein
MKFKPSPGNTGMVSLFVKSRFMNNKDKKRNDKIG